MSKQKRNEGPKLKLTKYEFKVCEAVQLGLDAFYMGPNDRRTLTQEDYETAMRLLPTLPKGWMQQPQEWMML